MRTIKALLLSKHLEADGNIVYIADGDADTMIVTCALQYAGQESEVNVVADDTDVSSFDVSLETQYGRCIFLVRSEEEYDGVENT